MTPHTITHCINDVTSFLVRSYASRVTRVILHI